jgi:hypothetical protein
MEGGIIFSGLPIPSLVFFEDSQILVRFPILGILDLDDNLGELHPSKRKEEPQFLKLFKLVARCVNAAISTERDEAIRLKKIAHYEPFVLNDRLKVDHGSSVSRRAMFGSDLPR